MNERIADKENTIIYDNTDGEGGITTPLKQGGFKTKGTDIRGGTNGRAIDDSVDCFAHPPKSGMGYHVLTGNCPFIHKMRYWIQCINSLLPYCITLPIETVGLVKMQPHLKDHGFDVYYMSPKPSFVKHGSKKKVCVGVVVWIFGNWGTEGKGVVTTRILSNNSPYVSKVSESLDVSDVYDVSDDSDDEDIDDLTVSIV